MFGHIVRHSLACRQRVGCSWANTARNQQRERTLPNTGDSTLVVRRETASHANEPFMIQTGIATMAQNELDVPQTLWLVSHESSDPMRLVMREIDKADAAADLERLLRKQRDRGMRVDPVDPHLKLDVRYQVFNDTGWVATYWLASEVADDEGMLTRISTPATQRPTHVRIPLSR